MPFMPGTGEIFVLCAALIGAGFGFLWFNTYPAEIFMGDTGSLALGALSSSNCYYCSSGNIVNLNGWNICG